MKVLIIVAVALIICMLYFIKDTKHLVISDYILEQKRIPEAFNGMRFVCMTDLHQTQYGKNNETLLKMIHSCRPDAILIAGDMITWNQAKHCGKTVAFLLKLAQEYPVYYTPGNHELKWSRLHENAYKSFTNTLSENGIYYLDNTDAIIYKGKDSIRIAGLNLPIDYYNKGQHPKELTVSSMNELISMDQERYTILLAHAPDFLDTYAKWGADCIIAGHNHGGIVRLGRLGGVISPRYQLFPHFDAGVYKKEAAVMFLSRGLGTHSIPIRVFNRPELISILIRNK